MDAEILKPLESLFANYIAAAISGSGHSPQFVEHIDNEKKVRYPEVIIAATTAEKAVIAQIPVWKVTFQVEVWEAAKQTDKNSDLADIVFSSICYDGIENDLNTIQDDIYIYEVV